jgi:NadR type nicotinamide-nucleotide adenylyltransferase
LEKTNTIQRVAIVGPESTGKSTLAEALAGYFKTTWVEEYARAYLTSLGRPYVLEDLIRIAQGQLALEAEKMTNAQGLLICDTNLLVIDVWSRHVFGESIPEVEIHLAKNYHYQLTLLTNTEVPWEPDPLREHPNARLILFELYVKRLRELKIPFQYITGAKHRSRLTQAVDYITPLLSPT